MKRVLACACVALWAAGMTACLAGDSEEEETDDEEYGSVQQAVGEGGLCGPPFWGSCNAGLSCCGDDDALRRCYNLQTSDLHCGTCGNDCTVGSPPYPFTHYDCILGVCHPVI
ncbi:MAG: hypothetical protein JNL21_18290 [Myxococcales bacterium]|nr:hypothetical protein [Myxococcales bacterium]